MVDFTSYVAPGVFVEDNTVPLTTSTGTVPSVVTLIGPSLGYQQVTVSTVLDHITAAVLANITAYATGDNAPVITKADGVTVLVAGTDYTASVDGTGHLSILRVNTSTAILDGDIVLVTYRYTTSDYYSVKQFFDYDTLVAVYGQPLFQPTAANPTPPANQVVSPLALAAKIAFENGANQLITLATDQRNSVTLRDALVSAYAKVHTDFRVGIIVPLLFDVDNAGVTTILSSSIAEGYITDLNNHCNAATADGLPRVGVVGLPNGFTTTGGYQNFIDVATFITSSRIVLAYPEALLYFNGYTNTILTIDGYYLAAAYAGRLQSLPVNKPLTKEVIASFAGLPGAVASIQTKAVKDNLAKSGIALVELDRFSHLSVRHGLNTNYGGGLTAREISVIRQRDSLFTQVSQGIESAALVGLPIEPETPLRVKSVISGILEQAVINNTILGYQSLQVRVQTGDPSIIEIKFAYTPALPLNYIVVSFSLNVQTGETDLAAVA